MKTEKLNLKALSVESFITATANELSTIKGGIMTGSQYTPTGFVVTLTCITPVIPTLNYDKCGSNRQNSMVFTPVVCTQGCFDANEK